MLIIMDTMMRGTTIWSTSIYHFTVTYYPPKTNGWRQHTELTLFTHQIRTVRNGFLLVSSKRMWKMTTFLAGVTVRKVS